MLCITKKNIFYILSATLICSLLAGTVYAMEMNINGKDKFVSTLSVDVVQISGKTDVDRSNPSGILTTGNITIASPQMTGSLKIIFVDPSFQPTDEDRQSISDGVVDRFSSDLAYNGMVLGSAEGSEVAMEFGDINSSEVFSVADSSGNYLGSAYGYWTDENVLNLFTLLGYDSQQETERQIKAMKIVRTNVSSADGESEIKVIYGTESSQGWLERGNALADQNSYDNALLAYDNAIELDPSNTNAWINKGNALNELGRYNESLQAYDRAIEIDPNSTNAWISKGNALNDQGWFEESLQAYDRAIEINPNSTNAWISKGLALNGHGMYEDAIAAMDKAIEINPGDADSWINKGLALYDQGRYDEAVQAYDRAIEINPNSASAWLNKGLALDKQGKLDEATEALNKAVELNPGYSRFLENRA